MGKLKKASVYLLLASGSSWGLLTPSAASAGFFSISTLLSSITPQVDATSAKQNSQTVPLLASATNIDPNPSVGGGDINVVGDSALLPQDGPSGTAAYLEVRPASSAISVYTVHAGDSLTGIARMFGVTVNTIKWANDLKGGTIHEGDVLVILPVTGIRYTVKKSDTLASLATKFKADAGDIANYNNLSDGASLAVGDTLIIPDGELASAPVATAPKKTGSPIKVKIGANGSTEPYLGGSGPAISGYYIWPAEGGVLTQGLHGFNGVDIGAPTGTAIFAAAAGSVIVAHSGGYNGGYGSYVVVKHPNGTQTLYAHMSRVLVSSGDAVAQGTSIGRVGSTGKSTGSHLHFEVRGATNPFAN